MHKLFSLIFLFLPSLCLAGQTHEFRLNNGLKLIVKEDHRAPVAISQIWYKVGSSYEYGGITGISHALEHMMFKGTALHPMGEFSKTMANNGAVENASTANDYTYYYQELAADKLALSFELEADRMRNLIVDPAEFNKEIQVVMEERRMRIDDDPQSKAYEQFNATSFLSNPYHHLTIGWMSDLQKMTADDVRDWYKKWYAPNNATIVVVGDVNPQQVYALAKKYFESIPAGTTVTLKPQTEIEQIGKREITVKIPAKLPWLTIFYHTPSLKTATNESEAYALEVLMNILESGSSARLNKELVRGSQIANDIRVGYSLYDRLMTGFIFSGTPASGKSVSMLKDAILQQIKRLQTEKVSAEELARVKTQMIANKRYSQDSITTQATELGSIESVGLSWKKANEYIDKIKVVTPEQIQDVARRYLIEDHMTVGILEPLPTTTQTRTNESIGVKNVH